METVKGIDATLDARRRTKSGEGRNKTRDARSWVRCRNNSTERRGDQKSYCQRREWIRSPKWRCAQTSLRRLRCSPTLWTRYARRLHVAGIEQMAGAGPMSSAAEAQASCRSEAALW